jgi:predicted nucleic acid-binding Zn ribbon protein
MGKDAATIRNQFQTRLGQIARELGREVYPDGLPRGTQFAELEAIAGALGDEMARQLIEINVQEQADDWPEEELGECPLCGGPARKAPDEPRVLKTTRGDGAWNQRVGNCPRGRRAFFPSKPGVGR